MILVFVSPNEQRAQRLSARLRDLAKVQWEREVAEHSIMAVAQRIGARLVLLDYSPDTAAGSSELAHRLMARAPSLSLIGVGSIRADHAAGVLAAWRAGVRDFLDMDAPDADIRSLLVRVQMPVALAHAPPASALHPHPRGRLVLLLGVRPGVGTSTLAAHLGVLAMSPGPAAATEEAAVGPGKQVLLLDLGRPAGDALLYLGVDSEFHYDEALRSAERIDATLIATALGHHDSRLTLLSQTPGTLEPPRSGGDLDILLERLRRHFELLLCDLGGLSFAQIPLVLLRSADEIWLIADQGIGAVVSLDALLHELQRAGLRDQRLSLVINRYDGTGGVEAEQMAARFGLPLLATLPERSRALRISASQGRLLHQVAPRDAYVRGLKPMLEKLHVKPIPVAGASYWKRLLTDLGIFRWKST